MTRKNEIILNGTKESLFIPRLTYALENEDIATISINDCRVALQHIESLVDLINKYNIEALNFTFLEVCSESAMRISNLISQSPSLTSISVRYVFQDVELIYFLKSLKNNSILNQISLTNSLDSIDANILFDNLPPNIKILKLDNNSLGNNFCGPMSKYLKLNGSLSEVYLRENEIGDSGIALLVGSLRYNTNLKILDLTKNKIGYIGACALSSMLFVNNTIEQLYLTENDLGNDGIVSIVASLNKNTTIDTIALSKLSPMCINSVADELSTNKTIKSLSISDSFFDEESCLRLVNAIIENNTLKELKLIEIHAIGQSTMCLYNFFSEHCALEKLCLENKNISTECVEMIARELSENNSLTHLDIFLTSAIQITTILKSIAQHNTLRTLNMNVPWLLAIPNLDPYEKIFQDNYVITELTIGYLVVHLGLLNNILKRNVKNKDKSRFNRQKPVAYDCVFE